MRFLFGVDLGDFLYKCDRRHPDLSSPEFCDFLGAADEIARVARFCAAERLLKPLSLISASCPKFHGALPSMARALQSAHREESRSRKSPSSVSISSALKEAHRLGADLPSSFVQFKERRGDPEAGSLAWAVMADRFRSVGCDLLASLAKDSAASLTPDSTGFIKLGILKSAAILCKTRGVRPESNRFVLVGPAGGVSLPAPAEDAMKSSDCGSGGLPIFDHHVLVCLAESPIFPSSVLADYVILGERDGESYFLFSD